MIPDYSEILCSWDVSEMQMRKEGWEINELFVQTVEDVWFQASCFEKRHNLGEICIYIYVLNVPPKWEYYWSTYSNICWHSVTKEISTNTSKLRSLLNSLTLFHTFQINLQIDSQRSRLKSLYTQSDLISAAVRQPVVKSWKWNCSEISPWSLKPQHSSSRSGSNIGMSAGI